MGVMPKNLAQLNDWSDDVILDVNAGTIDPTEAKRLHFMLLEIAKKIKPSVDEAILDEAQKYNEKTFSVEDMIFTKKEAGVNWDFSNCGDVEIENLNLELKSVKDKIKDREEFLKRISKPIEMHLGEGEVIELTPPVKKSTSIVTLKIK